MTRIGALFAGYGGLELGVHAVLGGSVAWHSEVDKDACKILAHHWPDVANHGDITAVDWAQVEPVDVLTGGFPCQDVSHAGKRAGIRPGSRSGLWSHMAHAVDQLRPALVVVENVRGLLSAHAHSDLEPCPWCLGDEPGRAMRALGAVLGDLAGLGYDAQWCGLRAADVGAPHGRFRVFVLAADARRIRRDARQRAAPHEATLRRPFRELAGRGLIRAAANANGRNLRNAARQGRDAPDGPLAANHGQQKPAANADSAGPQGRHAGGCGRGQRPIGSGGVVDWGRYGAAIARWETATGQRAPAPTEPGRSGQPRLSPRFVEWLMGLPPGWVTDVPGVGRNGQLKALGNGVVPQQAAAALAYLLTTTDVAA